MYRNKPLKMARKPQGNVAFVCEMFAKASLLLIFSWAAGVGLWAIGLALGVAK